MHHFEYRNQQLHAEDVDIETIAGSVGTPVYVYSSATLARHCRVMKTALLGIDHEIRFAVKSNSNLSVLATICEQGFGADVVSGGEIRLARLAGIPASRIVYSGVGKTDAEITYALGEKIGQFNVESASELERLSQLASSLGTDAPIAIRVNPNISVGGNTKISTGTSSNKFGVPSPDVENLYQRVVNDPRLRPMGLASHIGSQITDLEPMRRAFLHLKTMAIQFRSKGWPVPTLDVGGGLAAYYDDGFDLPGPQAYGDLLREIFEGFPVQIITEPGRLITANAGILLSSVIHSVERADRRFLVLDAAMNDLIRPSLYSATHTLIPVRQPEEETPRFPIDVVGPVCESGDTFALQIQLPPLRSGDRVAFLSAGAYGAVMASTYNARPLIGEVMVRGAQYAVVRPRQTLDAMISRDRLAPWLNQPVAQT